MPSQKLARSTYKDPTATDRTVPRPGNTLHQESDRDLDEYFRPLEKVHGSGLHGWGVAQGLDVVAVQAPPSLRVAPGVALNRSGQHISLAVGGFAEVGPDPDSNPAVLVPVLDTGAEVPTTGKTGELLLTVQYRETFDSEAHQSKNIFRYDHTPWLRLRTAAELDADLNNGVDALVLAKVTLSDAGAVTALGTDRRRQADLSTSAVRLRAAQSSAPAGQSRVGEADAGSIAPHAGGGVEIAVAQATDPVIFRQGDTPAQQNVVIIPAQAAVKLGAPTAPGRIDLHDAHDQAAIGLQAGNASISAGAPQNPGLLQLLDNAGQSSLTLSGATGDLALRGLIRNLTGQGVSHPQLLQLANYLPSLGELTGRNYSALHKHFSGNASQVYIQTRYVSSGATDVAEMDFGKSVRVFALTYISSLDPLNTFDRNDCVALEVYKVDGSDYQIGRVSGGDHFGAAGADENMRVDWFNGNAQKLSFRGRSFGEIWFRYTVVAFGEWWG